MGTGSGPGALGSSWVQPCLNLSSMDFGVMQDKDSFRVFVDIGETRGSVCFIEVGLGHLRLGGPSAFGNKTEQRGHQVFCRCDSFSSPPGCPATSCQPRPVPSRRLCLWKRTLPHSLRTLDLREGFPAGREPPRTKASRGKGFTREVLF